LLDSLFPVSIVPCGVKYCDYDYGVRSNYVKDAIGKSLAENATNFGVSEEVGELSDVRVPARLLRECLR
jgi:hypothetical protein